MKRALSSCRVAITASAMAASSSALPQVMETCRMRCSSPVCVLPWMGPAGRLRPCAASRSLTAAANSLPRTTSDRSSMRYSEVRAT